MLIISDGHRTFLFSAEDHKSRPTGKHDPTFLLVSFKNGPNSASFCLFFPFLKTMTSTAQILTINEKSADCVLGIRLYLRALSGLVYSPAAKRLSFAVLTPKKKLTD